MKPVIIKQTRGLGDILFCQKIAYHYIEQNRPVLWPVHQTYEYIAEYFTAPTFIYEGTDFPFKAHYLSCGYGQIFDIEECTIVCLDGASAPDAGVMRAKYKLVNLDYSDWVNYVQINRNFKREQELLERLGLTKNSEFVFVNRQYGSPPDCCSTNNYFKIESTLPTIELQYFEGVRAFDWMGVFELAKEIYTVDTSFSYILAAMKLENVRLYPRWNDNDRSTNLDYCSDFHNPRWKFGSNI